MCATVDSNSNMRKKKKKKKKKLKRKGKNERVIQIDEFYSNVMLLLSVDFPSPLLRLFPFFFAADL